jgi:hypothetical protein
MAGPYRKVERITVHSDMHLYSVLRLAGLLTGLDTINTVPAKISRVGSWSTDRCTVYRDIESVYTIYYTPGD